MNTYSDTSFLFAIYFKRSDSAAAIAHLATMKEPLQVGSVLRFEFTNAVRFTAFRGGITPQMATSALAAFELDIDNSRIVIPSVPWEQVHAEAERLSNAHTLTTGFRSFDILHVATAVTLAAKDFLTFDLQQRKLAITAGLKVKP